VIVTTNSVLAHLGSAHGSRAAIGGLANRSSWFTNRYRLPVFPGVRDEGVANNT